MLEHKLLVVSQKGLSRKGGGAIGPRKSCMTKRCWNRESESSHRCMTFLPGTPEEEEEDESVEHSTWPSQSQPSSVTKSANATAPEAPRSLPARLRKDSMRGSARNLALSRLEAALAKNVALELHTLQMGIVVDKVHERSCRREKRLLVVCPEEMLLCWGKDVRQLGRSHSKLDLYEVIRIHYGSMSRACVLHPELPPWLCFSLYTTRRSYDFCCADERAVQACVLGLSRLCEWAAGAMRGGRGNFVALKGWCKLQDSCFKQCVPLSHLFLDAVQRAIQQQR